jgi:hypothetical protein
MFISAILLWATQKPVKSVSNIPFGLASDHSQVSIGDRAYDRPQQFAATDRRS